MSKMSCNIKPNKTDYYLSEKFDFVDFKVDQTVLTKEEYLSKIPYLNYHKKEEESFKYDDVYPYVNSYYSHTEDADPLSKVNSLLAQPEILQSKKEKDAERRLFTHDAYSEREAQIRYLESRPVSFIILGKPDIGQQELGKDLARYWKCVYIEPQTLVEEEIESGSRAGECIEFNLRCGRAIEIDIILKLVEKKVKSETSRHRGFVLCGLPVIPNSLYQEDPISSEVAIFTAKDIFDEVFTVFADLCIAPSNPQVSKSSDFRSDAEQSTANLLPEETPPINNEELEINIGKNYEKQLDFLFGLLEEPFFIIYIHCGTMDVLKKRDSYRFDIYSNRVLDLQRRQYNHVFTETLTEEKDMDMFDEMFNPILLPSEDFKLKHLVKMPLDFKASISAQLDHYHYTALRFIQNRVIAHDPEYFIKVDGRTSISRMMSVIKAKLKIMNVQSVLIANKLISDDLGAYFKSGDTMLGEDAEPSPKPDEDDTPLTPQDCFKQLKKRQSPGGSYFWSWSEWHSRCPVSMKSGYIKEGNVRYPVQFMNKIFFLADEAAFFQFCSNPRPFLLPPFPRTTCRIFVFGPRYSGRTALSHCIAYYLGGVVLSAEKMINDFRKQRQDEYLEKVRKQAIAEGISLLNKNRTIEADQQEKERVEKIKEWVRTCLALLEELSNVIDEIEREEKKEKFEISSFPMAMKTVQTSEVLENSELAQMLNRIREQLLDLNVPINQLDASVWKTYVTDRRKLLQYLPPEIKHRFVPKPANVKDDFVREYVASALAHAGLTDIHMSGGGLFETFKTHIKEADQKYRNQGYGRGGWVIDGMTCNLQFVQSFFPDYTADDIIVLKDTSDSLVKNYENRIPTFFNDYRNFFRSIGRPDAAWRSPSITSNDEFREGLVKSIINEILEDTAFYNKQGSEDDIENSASPRVDEYKNELKVFERDWGEIKNFYSNNDIIPMEIDVSGKTLPQIFKETLKTLDNKYSYNAHQMTQEDLAEEIALYQPETEDHLVGEDQSTEEEIIPEPVAMRKYGDTLNFCPVTLSIHNALWRGREEFAVKYNDRVYLLSSKSEIELFLKDPRMYLPDGYLTKIPPPRICVVGVSGCGKTRLSKSLAKNYGLIYISYEHSLKKYFQIETEETLTELATNSTVSDLQSYLNGGGPLQANILTHLKRFWSEEPFKSKGFVLDDFPKTHHDVDSMKEYKLIPDIIIYPQADETYLKTKFLDKYLKSWQDAVDRQRNEIELKYNVATEKWRKQRLDRFNELIEERREKRYSKKVEKFVKDGVASGDGDSLKSSSLVSFDSVADQQDVDEVNKILDIELPPIVFNIPYQDPEEFMSKTEPLVYNRIHSDSVAIDQIKEKCDVSQIPFKLIPLNLDDFDRTIVAGYSVVEPLKFRNLSYFESCYDVPVEVADSLLDCGYLFLSKFGKTCPVQYLENEIPLQMYQVEEKNNNLFPVVHRSYIYFIIGEERRDMFKRDPLRYIKNEFRFPLRTYRIAVTGPPKCGKTILSQRIEKEFGFKSVSRGQAARYVLKYLFDSDLARTMESVLRKGWELTDEMAIKSVEAAMFDATVATRGVVFDGFPNILNETKHMAFLDLVPNLVINLKAGYNDVVQCSINAIVSKSELPKFGPAFMKHLFDNWAEEEEFRNWFDNEYQSMRQIPIDSSIWSVWHKSESYLLSTFYEIIHYCKHIGDDWPLRLGNMLVTPLEFLERQSSFKSYCPVCLHISNNLVTGGDPPDRTGLVQFRQYFYWICDNHLDMFLKHPESYLPPYNQRRMPSVLPKRASFASKPNNLYENGECAVCYKTKLIVTNGKLTLCSTYNDKVYLFDTVECLNTFLRNPQMFQFAIEFRAPAYPELKYRDLPIMGMLEQYVASYVVKGISYISRRRVVIPGLSIKASALVGLGLFIKAHNERPNPLHCFYEEGFRLYNNRRDKLLKYLDMMRTYRNPYLYYEEPLPPFHLPPATPKTESLTTMVSRMVDQCVDNIDLYMQDDQFGAD